MILPLEKEEDLTPMILSTELVHILVMAQQVYI